MAIKKGRNAVKAISCYLYNTIVRKNRNQPSLILEANS